MCFRGFGFGFFFLGYELLEVVIGKVVISYSIGRRRVCGRIFGELGREGY